MKYLATIVYERAPALRITFAFKHGCLATNHNDVNTIIICYHNFALYSGETKR